MITILHLAAAMADGRQAIACGTWPASTTVVEAASWQELTEVLDRTGDPVDVVLVRIDGGSAAAVGTIADVRVAAVEVPVVAYGVPDDGPLVDELVRVGASDVVAAGREVQLPHVVRVAAGRHRSTRTRSSWDPLTGLLTRPALEQRVDNVRDLAARLRRGLAVGVLEVEGLHAHHLRLGREAGAQTLRHVSDALRRSMRAGDLLARDGDAGFLFVGLGDDGSSRRIVADLRLELSVHQLRTGVSIGTCEVDHDHDLGEAIGRAQRALVHDRERNALGAMFGLPTGIPAELADALRDRRRERATTGLTDPALPRF